MDMSIKFLLGFLLCVEIDIYSKSYMEIQGTSNDQNNRENAKVEGHTLPFYKGKVIKTNIQQIDRSYIQLWTVHLRGIN